MYKIYQGHHCYKRVIYACFYFIICIFSNLFLINPVYSSILVWWRPKKLKCINSWNCILKSFLNILMLYVFRNRVCVKSVWPDFVSAVLSGKWLQIKHGFAKSKKPHWATMCIRTWQLSFAEKGILTLQEKALLNTPIQYRTDAQRHEIAVIAASLKCFDNYQPVGVISVNAVVGYLLTDDISFIVENPRSSCPSDILSVLRKGSNGNSRRTFCKCHVLHFGRWNICDETNV